MPGMGAAYPLDAQGRQHVRKMWLDVHRYMWVEVGVLKASYVMVARLVPQAWPQLSTSQETRRAPPPRTIGMRS